MQLPLLPFVVIPEGDLRLSLFVSSLSFTIAGRSHQIMHTRQGTREVVSRPSLPYPHPAYAQGSAFCSPQLLHLPKKHHLDRSCSRSHREQRSGETPAFVFAVATVTAFAYLRLVIPHPNRRSTNRFTLRMNIPTSKLPKPCQAPLSTKPASILHKRVAHEFPSIL